MKYPRNQGPRTLASWKKKRKDPCFEPPYELVEKEVCGERVMVKVYEPAYGRKSDESNYTRFHHERPATKSDLAHATEVSMNKFPTKSKKSK
jgi:hypothetical protein